MRLNDLIKLYARMRMALLIVGPFALYGLEYMITGGDMLVSWIGSVWLVFPLFDWMPSPTEVQRILKTRETTGHIWYMVEYQDGTRAKMGGAE